LSARGICLPGSARGWSREEIEADIKALEQDILKMLREVAG
jgi:hypothetical protein